MKNLALDILREFICWKAMMFLFDILICFHQCEMDSISRIYWWVLSYNSTTYPFLSQLIHASKKESFLFVYTRVIRMYVPWLCSNNRILNWSEFIKRKDIDKYLLNNGIYFIIFYIIIQHIKRFIVTRYKCLYGIIKRRLSLRKLTGIFYFILLRYILLCHRHKNVDHLRISSRIEKMNVIILVH